MTYRTLAILFAAVLATSCSSCADDTNNDGTGECPAGEVFNPVVGSCQPPAAQNSTTPDAGNPEDTGPSNNRRVDGGGTVGEDMGAGCLNNERRCSGNVVERCVNGVFETAETCGDGLVCERGNCVPEDSGACTPGETRCSGTNTFETCQPDGMTWGSAQTCDTGEVCAAGDCASGCAGLLTEKSNVGCEYFSLRHKVVILPGSPPHTVVVSNPGDNNVTVQVDSPGGINPGIAQQTIAPLDSAVLTLPNTFTIDTPGLSKFFYRIRSSEPVIATQFAPLNNPGAGRETSDASLLLPTNAIGQEYVAVTWRGLDRANGQTYIDIVSLEADTTVMVESPVQLTAGAEGMVPANGSTMFTIPAESQALHLEDMGGNAGDVTGAIITADKPIAVYTGSTISDIPDAPVVTNPAPGCTAVDQECTANADCCTGLCGYFPNSADFRCTDDLRAGDHLEQQLFPVESWGTSYVAAPFFARRVDDFTMYRIVASVDGTNVTVAPPVNGISNVTLNRGETAQFYGPDAFELTADQPVMVGQFMIGGQISDSGDGDPAFLLPPAIEQFRDSYVFLVPDNYRANFVTLIKKPGTTITLDNNAVPQADFLPVGTAGNWEYAIIESIGAGVHRANSAEPFGIVVHGMDEYISYAFAGGIVLPE